MRSGTVLQVAVLAAAALLHLEVTANNSVVGEEALFGGSPDKEHHRRALGFHKMVYYPNSNIQGVIGGITAAFFVKITSGVDDIVWLAPYLSTLHRRKNFKNAITYVWMCGFQTILALVVSSASSNSGDALSSSSPDSWSGDKCLIVTAGGSLVGYGIYLLWEHARDVRRLKRADKLEYAAAVEPPPADAAAAAEDGGGASATDRLLKSCGGGAAGGAGGASAPPEVADEDTVRRKTLQMQLAGPHGNLLVLAFLGSIDDLTLFVPMLMGNRFIWYQLLLGATLASIVIVTVGMSIMMCTPVAVFVRQIPIGLVVFLYAGFLVFKGLSMH